MTSLIFTDRLITSTFANNNSYLYTNLQETNLRFYKDCPNFPYVMMNGYHNDRTLLKYVSHQYQLRNRLINTAKIKEVMDSAHLPLMFSIRGKWYLIGKGFMAHITNINEPGESLNLLFVACIDSTQVIRSINQVKFIVSRDIYKEDYKAILPAIKDIMTAHTGDVILTSDINNKIGDKIPFPSGGTIDSRMEYKKKVMLECIKDFFIQ